ncbi:hypothetical protein HELRODRAFT_180233 [Helobdella robusta]|uniref:Uncharacterized protein n=1 Tax=Helobdella robusta TaxID=6412 RepID=T1FFL4_HELRO|nr:hypothetical protein HELRODRAFT_180233 [Helobdella robusta]ESN94066.1 hypothetical protein HELRODRAFT_180233 [Helobdella robusta]
MSSYLWTSKFFITIIFPIKYKDSQHNTELNSKNKVQTNQPTIEQMKKKTANQKQTHQQQHKRSDTGYFMVGRIEANQQTSHKKPPKKRHDTRSHHNFSGSSNNNAGKKFSNYSHNDALDTEETAQLLSNNVNNDCSNDNNNNDVVGKFFNTNDNDLKRSPHANKGHHKRPLRENTGKNPSCLQELNVQSLTNFPTTSKFVNKQQQIYERRDKKFSNPTNYYFLNPATSSPTTTQAAHGTTQKTSINDSRFKKTTYNNIKGHSRSFEAADDDVF